MKLAGRFLVVFALFVQGSFLYSAEPDVVVPNSGSTFVLVHGAWGGSYDWKDMERRLEAMGHTVYRPALTGHGERYHLSNPDIDLSMHIQDVVGLIEWEQLENVVLMGHSYGGMVITGVADRVPERIKSLVYLDAFVPEDGESTWPASQTGAANSEPFSTPPWVNVNGPIPHNVPHSTKCFSEQLSLTNPLRMEISTTYVYLVDPGRELEEDTFHRFYLRAKEYGWKTIIMKDRGHNAHTTHPDEIAEVFHNAR